MDGLEVLDGFEMEPFCLVAAVVGLFRPDVGPLPRADFGCPLLGD